MDSKDDVRFNRQFDRIGQKFPAVVGFLNWVRRPSSRLIRIPLAIVLIFGGIFSFLPILGLWMLPLGFLLLALDLPALRGPLNRTIVWVQRKWTNWRRSRRKS